MLMTEPEREPDRVGAGTLPLFFLWLLLLLALLALYLVIGVLGD
jgi:hypothetical protein